MSLLRVTYLLLAILGLIMTWYYNLQFMADSNGGFDIGEFVAAAANNAAAQSITWDLTIACIAGLLWIVVESKRLEMRFAWAYVVFAFLIAYAFVFPLFLFFRQGKLEQDARP